MNITIIKILLGLHIFGTGTATTPLSIRGCHGELAELFVDKQMTLRAVNPYLTDRHGHFDLYIYTKDKCVSIGGAK